METGKQYITVQQLAEKLKISIRGVQKKLQSGNPIPFVKCYSKLRDAQTSAYLIEPTEDFYADQKVSEK